MISVIVPVKNVEKYLKECLSSVLSQSYKDFELICINDGSTDSSYDILKKFAKNDKRIVLISHAKSLGVSAARNAGLEIARGEFIFFLDSDDFLLPDSLERMNRLMTPDVDAVISSVKDIFDESFPNVCGGGHSIPYQGKIRLDYADLFKFNQAVFPKLYRRERIKKLKLSFPTDLLWEDNYWHWLYFSGMPCVYFDQIPAYCYRRRLGSIMSSVFNRSNNRLSEHFDISRKIFEFYEQAHLMEHAAPHLVKLLENFLLFCLQHASIKESLICCDKCKELVSNYSLDVSSSWVLTQLVSNSCSVLLLADTDLDFVIKINKIAQLVFPKDSFRRKLFLCFLTKLGSLIK